MNVAWQPEGSSRYESLWASLHRFAFLNGATYSNLRTLISLPVEHAKVYTRDLNYLWGLNTEKMAAFFQRSTDELKLSVPYEYGIGRDREASKYLRYCPVCILRGFHSAAFQIQCVELCPIHNVPIQDRCPECAQGIRYRLGQRELAVPFGCPCGNVLWPGLFEPHWRRPIDAEDERVFESLRAWVQEFRGKGSSAESWEKGGVWMKGLAALQPVAGWPPEAFGGSASGVFEVVYRRKVTPVIENNGLPINIGGCEGAESILVPMKSRIGSTMYRKIVPQVLALVRAVRRSIGVHLRCSKEVVVYGDHVGVHGQHYCPWGIAYRSWLTRLWEEGWLGYRNSLSDIDRNLRGDRIYGKVEQAICGLTRAPRVEDRPLMDWLTCQVIRAELLHELGREIVRFLDDPNRPNGPKEKDPFHSTLTEEPMLAYYPPSEARRPRLRVYVGFSLKELAEHVSQSGICGADSDNPHQW
jgi:hypothetical protein